MGDRSSRAAQPRDRALLKAREAGLTYAEIAREFRIGRTTVHRRLRALEAMQADVNLPQTVVVSTRGK